jgi:hypothetical protein
MAVVVGALLASTALASPAAAVGPTAYKVALIVGPVGELVTPWYIAEAERIADMAEARGAEVARAYSPAATPDRVLRAVADANIVVYFGHGNGFPSPYAGTLLPDRVDGWGLQGPGARGTHADSWQDGALRYYGESWILEHARPAPGFVMVYSNTCYATGGPELWMPPATAEEARQRVENYSRPVLALGAAGYFATDYNGAAARLVGSMLANPRLPFEDLFRADPRFRPAGLATMPHRAIAGAEVWLHRSPDDHGRYDYWYAFAGNPSGTLARSMPWEWPDAARSRVPLRNPLELIQPTNLHGYPDAVWGAPTRWLASSRIGGHP